MTVATGVRGTLDATWPPRADLGHDEPGWLARARREAWAWVSENGFPTRKHEDWRYVRLDPILQAGFEPAMGGAAHEVSPGSIAGLGDLGGARLLFVDGHLEPGLSRLEALPDGATVTNLASLVAAGDERPRRLWAPRAGSYRHAFAALNAALAEDGAFIWLRAGTVLAGPIELVFWSSGGDPPAVSSPRSIILAGAGARGSVVETYAGASGGVYCTNAVTQVFLDEGAQVEHHRVQAESEGAFHLASLQASLGRASRLSSRSLTLGSAISRQEVDVRLPAEEAEVDLEGLYLPTRSQHHDNPILVEHAAPRCVSRQLYKGVVDGAGHGVFNGHIVVRPGAFGTDASQTNKNLVLSDRAEVDTRPRLEIFADDVMCTHGAAVGRLDEEALFYLRSRGIPHEEARGLLTNGFAREMVTRWPDGPLRARAERLVANRLGAAHDGLRTGLPAGLLRPLPGEEPR
ncbi:MAG: Fe-S cluster assembly protein SufD [Acidimicrobiales bacterium]